MKVNLIIPAKEDERNLSRVIKPLLKNKNIKNIILVLHKKNKKKILTNKKLKIIIQKKPGYGAAIKEGFKISNTKFSCIFNADGSFNIKSLKKMILLTKKNDFVFASRYMKGAGSDDDNFITLFGNYFFSLLGRALLNIKLNDLLYTYILCNTKNFNKFNLRNNDFRLCVELPYKIENTNQNYTFIKSKEFKRKFGKKNVNEFKDGFLILTEVIKCFAKKIMKI